MQKSYDELGPQEKSTLVLGPDVFVFPHNDPETAIDYAGMSGTLNLTQYLDVVNNSTLDLYFKIEATVLSGDASKWSGLSSTFPVTGATSKAQLEWNPSREVPSAKTTETLRINLKAFKDSGFTELYGEDYVDFTYHFFNHSEGTVVHFADFENGYDGWSSDEGGYLHHFGTRQSKYAYTGSWSLALAGFRNYSTCEHADNWVTDVSGQIVPAISGGWYGFRQQTFDLSGFSSVYLVLHVTYLIKSGDVTPYSVLRILTSSKDYIIRIPIPVNTYQPYRVAIPLSAISSETIKITGTFENNSTSSKLCSTQTHLYVDTIMIVGFS